MRIDAPQGLYSKHCSIMYPNICALFCVNCQSFYLWCLCRFIFSAFAMNAIVRLCASVYYVCVVPSTYSRYSAVGSNKCIVAAAFNSFFLSSIYFILGSIHGNNFYFVRLRYRRNRDDRAACMPMLFLFPYAGSLAICMFG